MSNILTAVRLAVLERVQGITAANGYRTSIGDHLKTGWLNEVLGEKNLPDQFALVQRAKNNPPEPGPAAIKVHCGFFVVGLIKTDLLSYEEALEAMELDICQALMPRQGGFPAGFPKGVTALTLGATESFPPGDGQRHAGVLVPVHITTIIQEQIRR